MSTKDLPADLATVVDASASPDVLSGLVSLLSAVEMSHWRARLRKRLADEERVADQLTSALSRATELQRQRLEHTAAAHRAYAAELASLMSRLGAHQATEQAAVYEGLGVGAGVELDGYASNIHRDWGWGEAENVASIDLISALLGDVRGKRVLVLGCGAGRLTYDLHQRCNPALSVGLDHNPLLLSVAARISAGETLTLHEFPRAPRSVSDSAVSQQLQAPAPAREGLHFVLGDIFDTALKLESFDVVVTHWFVDIVPFPFADVTARVNTLLRTDGLWINSGSLAFSENRSAAQSHTAQAQTLEEAIEVATGLGFDDWTSREDSLPYLNSPHSRTGRVEEVVSWRARKARACAATNLSDSRPAWLQDSRKPIPVLSEIAYQAEATKIHAYVLALVDGKRSLRDIAAVFEKQNLMPADEAEVAIADMLAKLV